MKDKGKRETTGACAMQLTSKYKARCGIYDDNLAG
jgi:hypothetical protein